MTKNKVVGRDMFSSPNQFYKKELLEIEGNSIWVREASTKAMADFVDAGNVYSEKIKEGTPKAELEQENYRIIEDLFKACLCDEHGDPIYADKEIDVSVLPDSVTLKIIEKIMELSGKGKVQEVAANLKKEGIA